MSSLLPRIPPSVEIRLLIHEMNFHLACDEALYVSRLRGHGINEMRALDAYRFTQIALGRRLKVLQGVPLPDAYLRFDTAGRCIDGGRLSEQPLFREASQLAATAFSPWTAQAIGDSSPEVLEFHAQIDEGRTPAEVVLAPCVLFTKLPDKRLIEHASREAAAPLMCR